MKVPDYRVPVLDTQVQLYGKKKEDPKKPLKEVTSQKLRVNQQSHRIQQVHILRKDDILKKQLKKEQQIEKQQKKRVQKEIQKEQEQQKEYEQQIEDQKKKEREQFNKKDNKILFKTNVHEHFTDVQKSQKMQQLRAQSAQIKKKDKEYNKKQMEDTRKFMQKINQQKNKTKQIQQKQQEKQQQVQCFYFSRKQPQNFMNQSYQNLMKSQQQLHMQSNQPKKMTKKAPIQQQQQENVNFLGQEPAPGHHFPENVGRIDINLKKEAEKKRQQVLKNQEQKYGFKGSKHNKLICQNFQTIKNSDSDNFKFAIIEPCLPQKDKKFAFKIINGFFDSIYIGVCLKDSIPKNFTIEKQELISKNQNKLAIQNVILLGNKELYLGDKEKGQQAFKIEKNNILLCQFQYSKQKLIITKESSQEQVEMDLNILQQEQKEKNEQQENKEIYLCIISGHQKDQIQYINNIEVYRNKQKKEQEKRENEQKQKRLEEKQKYKKPKDKEEEEEQQKEKEKKEKDKQWLNADNKSSKNDDQESKSKQKQNNDAKNQKKQQVQQQVKFIQFKSGYFPEAKNKKFISHKFSQLERQSMINMEVVKVPGPGSYDPVNPKAIRNKDYGSYYKGPLPFLSTCQNVKFGKESKDSAGCTFMNGGNGVFDYGEDNNNNNNNNNIQVE